MYVHNTCMYVYYIAIITGIAVLRKHYHMLLASLPDDHVTTVSILSETVPVDELFFNEVISFTDHSVANEKILIAMILMVNRDTQFKGFAQLAQLIAKRDCKFSREMLEFDIGEVYVSSYICVCISNSRLYRFVFVITLRHKVKWYYSRTG